jgi:hypothetical protein
MDARVVLLDEQQAGGDGGGVDSAEPESMWTRVHDVARAIYARARARVSLRLLGVTLLVKLLVALTVAQLGRSARQRDV